MSNFKAGDKVISRETWESVYPNGNRVEQGAVYTVSRVYDNGNLGLAEGGVFVPEWFYLYSPLGALRSAVDSLTALGYTVDVKVTEKVVTEREVDF